MVSWFDIKFEIMKPQFIYLEILGFIVVLLFSFIVMFIVVVLLAPFIFIDLGLDIPSLITSIASDSLKSSYYSISIQFISIVVAIAAVFVSVVVMLFSIFISITERYFQIIENVLNGRIKKNEEELKHITESIKLFYLPLCDLLTTHDENVSIQARKRKIVEINAHKHLAEPRVKFVFEKYINSDEGANRESRNLLELVTQDIELLQHTYKRIQIQLK